MQDRNSQLIKLLFVHPKLNGSEPSAPDSIPKAAKVIRGIIRRSSSTLFAHQQSFTPQEHVFQDLFNYVQTLLPQEKCKNLRYSQKKTKFYLDHLKLSTDIQRSTSTDSLHNMTLSECSSAESIEENNVLLSAVNELNNLSYAKCMDALRLLQDLIRTMDESTFSEFVNHHTNCANDNQTLRMLRSDAISVTHVAIFLQLSNKSNEYNYNLIHRLARAPNVYSEYNQFLREKNLIEDINVSTIYPALISN